MALLLRPSIHPNFLLVPSDMPLRTKELSELTWNYVAAFLIDDYNARRMGYGSSKTSRIAKKTKTGGSLV